MARTTAQPLLLLPHTQQRGPPPANRAWGAAVIAAAVLVLLLLAAAGGPLRPRRLFGAPPVERVELTLLAGAAEKGAVCLDGTPPGYHLQRGSGDGSNSWLVHLEGGAWCGTFKECSDRRLTKFGSSNFMRSLRFAGSGILGGDEQLNPYFYNWNRVYVRYCDGASFSGEAEGQAEDGSTLHFRGFRIYEAVIDELMEKGLANASENVRKVLPKDCLVNKEPTECFFPAEVIKTIHTPMFILNSGYDSWQIQNIIVPGSAAPDNSWLSCKENIRNCNSTQIEFLDGFRNTMVDSFKVVEDNEEWGLFIVSCFTHCQTLSDISWAISPRIGNKTISEAVGDWHHGRSQGAKEIDCKYPCNPTCNNLLPP